MIKITFQFISHDGQISIHSFTDDSNLALFINGFWVDEEFMPLRGCKAAMYFIPAHNIITIERMDKE